jgi:two-component system response regulator BaeR
MAQKRILVVEDEAKIASLLKDYLENSGFAVSIQDNGEKVIPYIKDVDVDLILLDIMLPGLDGLSVCRDIRRFSNIPIIIVTARVEEIDALLGLEMGSDDYIRKPFRPREVVARVKAVLRRSQPSGEDAVVRIGAMVLNEEEYSISVDGTVLDLTPNEFGILKALICRPGKVFTRSQLVDKVQGYNYEGYERTIDTHIKNIRKKLSILLPKKDIIKAVYGVGYKLDRNSLKSVSE